MSHPETLWQEPPPGFEIVRAMGRQTQHLRRQGDAKALCGWESPSVRGKRWNVYRTRTAGAPWCKACVVAWGKAKVSEAEAAGQRLSKTVLKSDEAWPFPGGPK